jgi:hypothetical protein
VIKDTTWLLLVNLFVPKKHIWLFLLEEYHKLRINSILLGMVVVGSANNWT